jgi:hypothetical protein
MYFNVSYNSLTQHKELVQDEFGVFKLGSPSTNSPPMPSFGMVVSVSFQYMLCLLVAFPNMHVHSSRFI